MQTRGVTVKHGLKCDEITAFVEAKQERGEELSDLDNYAVQHANNGYAWFSLQNVKREKDFIEYLRNNDLIRNGADLHFETLDEDENNRYMVCGLRIGSSAYRWWFWKQVEKRINRLVYYY